MMMVMMQKEEKKISRANKRKAVSMLECRIRIADLEVICIQYMQGDDAEQTNVEDRG